MRDLVLLADEVSGDARRLENGGQTTARMRAAADQITIRKLFELVMGTHVEHLVPTVRHVKCGAEKDRMILFPVLGRDDHLAADVRCNVAVRSPLAQDAEDIFAAMVFVLGSGLVYLGKGSRVRANADRLRTARSPAAYRMKFQAMSVPWTIVKANRTATTDLSQTLKLEAASHRSSVSVPRNASNTMNIFKIVILVLDDRSFVLGDAIMYQDKLWLVPEWRVEPATETERPTRIIELHGLPVQKAGNQYQADLELLIPLTKDTLAGGTAQGLVVIEAPEIIRKVDTLQ